MSHVAEVPKPGAQIASLPYFRIGHNTCGTTNTFASTAGRWHDDYGLNLKAIAKCANDASRNSVRELVKEDFPI